MLHGVLNVNKPAGMTSHDVVDRIRRMARMRRVGHTGTLDPMATGVLPLCLGKATKIAQYLLAVDKRYDVEMTLGIVTDSQDSTGNILEEREVGEISLERLQEVFAAFTGSIEQTPPMVSAKHHKGVRLYELARKGIEVERAKQHIHIESLELKEFCLPRVRFQAHCSKGTYMRTLCHDMGEQLGPGACMSALSRLSCGCFKIEEAAALDALTDRETIIPHLKSLNDALLGFPGVYLQPVAVHKLLNGRAVTCGEVNRYERPYERESLVRLLNPAGELLALGKAQVGAESLLRLSGGIPAVRPVKVFMEPKEAINSL